MHITAEHFGKKRLLKNAKIPGAAVCDNFDGIGHLRVKKHKRTTIHFYTFIGIMINSFAPEQADFIKITTTVFYRCCMMLVKVLFPENIKMSYILAQVFG